MEEKTAKQLRKEGIEMLMSKNGWTWVRAQAHYQKFGIGETQLTRYFRLGPEGWVLVTAADALKYAKS